MERKRRVMRCESEFQKIAVENALVLFFFVFLLGLAVGWRLAHISGSLWDDVIWIGVYLVAFAWIVRRYYVTAGLGARRPG